MALKELKAPGWPAPQEAIEQARDFLRRRAVPPRLVLASARTLDALAATALLQRTLGALDVPLSGMVLEGPFWSRRPARVRASISAAEPERVLSVGQRSPLQSLPRGLPAQVITRLRVESPPAHVQVVSSHGIRPRVPVSLLSFFVASPLVEVPALEWLALLGTLAEAGPNAPYAGYKDALKRHGRMPLTDASALIHAASHAAAYDPHDVLEMLASASKPLDIARGRVAGLEALRACRDRVHAELLRCVRAAPHTTGRIAVALFSSQDAIQPLIAARWAQRLPELVSVAVNTGLAKRSAILSIRSRQPTGASELLESLEVEGLELLERSQRGVEAALPTERLSPLLEALGFRVRDLVDELPA